MVSELHEYWWAVLGLNQEMKCSSRIRYHRVHKLRDGEEVPFAGHTLERVSAAILELES